MVGAASIAPVFSKVGISGAKTGLQADPVTIAGPLKNNGYATGQFGKNHLGGKYNREQTKPTHQVDLRK